MDPSTAEILRLKHRIAELEEIIARNEITVDCPISPKQNQKELLLEKEVERLRNSLLRSQELYEQTKHDLEFLLSQKKEDGLMKLLAQKDEEIERLKQQSILV